MKGKAKVKTALGALLALVCVLFAAGPLFAQCAMCYQNAAAQSAQGMRALNLGILVLLLPPAAIAACIARAAYRCRESSPAADSPEFPPSR